MDLAPELIEIRLDNEKKTMLAIFSDDKQFNFSFEFLRVYSPSAEVRGHNEAESVLQTGKKNVMIEEIEPVGHYAIQIRFDDGHKTGLYTFEWLYELGLNREILWEEYLARLKQAGATRTPLPVL